MLSKYGSWIFDEPIAYGMELLQQAIDDKLEDRVWLYYCCTLPYQDKKNRKSFDDLMASIKSPQNNKTKSVITQKELDRFVDIADLVRSK